KVPSGRCRQRHCDFWITDTAKIVSVSIDLRHEMRKGGDLRTDRSRRSLYSPRIGHARKRRKSAALNRDQGFVAETRVLRGRWWCAAGAPRVPPPPDPPHHVARRCRIVHLLPATSLASPCVCSRHRRRADRRKGRDDVLRPCQEIDPDVVRQHEVAFT